MARDTVTLNLEGQDITMEEYARAVAAFAKLIESISTQVAKKNGVDWKLAGLVFGSAQVAARGVDRTGVGLMPRVVRSIEDASERTRKTGKSGISWKVDRQFKELLKLTEANGRGRGRSIRIETDDKDVELHSPKAPPNLDEGTISIGSVQGRVQTLTETRGLRFVLYEHLSGRPVSCYLIAGHEEQMREIWGRMVVVEGEVRRETLSGAPTTVRHIRHISRVIPDEGVYSDAIGAFAPRKEFANPEDLIRELRDDWR